MPGSCGSPPTLEWRCFFASFSEAGCPRFRKRGCVHLGRSLVTGPLLRLLASRVVMGRHVDTNSIFCIPVFRFLCRASGRTPDAPTPRPALRVPGGGGGSPPWGGCGSIGGFKILSFSLRPSGLPKNSPCCCEMHFGTSSLGYRGDGTLPHLASPQ